MANHYVYRDGLGNFKIRGNANNTEFYVYTSGATVSPPGDGGTPGPVASFMYSSIGNTACVDNDLSFSWSAPLDDGGSPITGYVIRRIYTAWINDTVYFSGYPAVISFDELFELCFNTPAQEVAPINPLVLGNINSVDFSGVACGPYSYQIAAVNVNGTGTYYPFTAMDLTTVGLGWIQAGSRGYTVTNLGEGSIEINYPSNIYNGYGDQICNPGSTFGGVTSNLYEFGVFYDWDGTGPDPNIVDSYSSSDSINAGKVFFDGQSPGIYYATIEETWYSEEYQECKVQKHVCSQPFEIT